MSLSRVHFTFKMAYAFKPRKPVLIAIYIGFVAGINPQFGLKIVRQHADAKRVFSSFSFPPLSLYTKEDHGIK